MEEENKQNDWRPIWIYLLVTIISTMIIGLIIGIIGGFLSIPESNFKEASSLLEPISLVLSNAIISIILIILYYKRLKKDLIRLTKKNIINIIVSSIIIILLNELITYIFTLLKIEINNQDTLNSYFLTLKIPVAISITLLAPFAEEMTFRYSLETVCKSDTSFLIISSILFGIAHGIGIATLLYIFIGCSLSIIYLKNDKNIIAPMIVHMLNNIISIIEMIVIL